VGWLITTSSRFEQLTQQKLVHVPELGWDVEETAVSTASGTLGS